MDNPELPRAMGEGGLTWTRSAVTRGDLSRLACVGFIPNEEHCPWRVPIAEVSPHLRGGECVLFASHLKRGLPPSASILGSLTPIVWHPTPPLDS